ncbi:hypothetical protein FOL47_006622 [Perkinsus chesapeaki]|uniref:Uncharacterized protein n=1 Tax=Perkinsus chesapeaki TaxID=330153 RepID=A0A7J6LQX6_PERCH|nr:hypothetical protein FOL47_006622 [Perkinsus chesapeaki]
MLVVSQVRSRAVKKMPPAHFIFGDDGHGRRYYVDVIPEGMELVHEDHFTYIADGYACSQRTITQRYSDTAPRWVYISTTDEEKGSQNFRGELDISDEECVATFQLLEDVRPQSGPLKVVDNIGKDQPLLKSFNEMYRNGKLRYMQFHEVDKPASNALYYGFKKDGFDVQITTDGDGRINSVVKNDPKGLKFKRLVYVMYGNAMKVTFYDQSVTMHINLEQVDKGKGKEGFAQSRVPVAEGEPLNQKKLMALVYPEEPESPKTSSVGNFLSKFGLGKKRQYRRVGSHSSSEDDEQESLLGE